MYKPILLFIGSLLLLAQTLVAQIDNNCTVLQNNTIITVTKNGLLETEQVTLLVHNRTGDCYSTIRIPYSKITPIGLAVAQIELLDGTVVRKLKPKEAVEKSDISSFSLYEDRMIYEFDLRHNVYPYVVRYEYTRKSTNYIGICNWTPMYHPELKTLQATLSIQLPASKKLNVYKELIGDASVDNSNGDITTYKWTSSYTPIAKELYTVNKFNTLPKVIATTPDFFYGISGDITSWANFGNWYAQLTQGLDMITPGEKAVVDRLKAETTSTPQLIDKLYKHLQTTKRYINVSTNIGGIKPHPASYVCSNGYGDCKALSNYMKAILAYAGIESNLVLIYSDDKPLQVPLSFPCDLFNHVILCIPNQRDTIWLECTSNISPTGYLGESTQNRYGLFIDDDNSKLVRTPKLTPQQCLVVKKCHIAKNGETNYNITFNGPSFEDVRGIDNGLSQHWHEYVLDHYLMPAFDAKEWKFSQPEPNIPQIELAIKGNWGEANEAQPNYDTYFISFPSLAIPQLQKNANRQLPLYFPYPIMVVDTTLIETNATFTKLENNASITIEGEMASYSKTLVLEGNTVKIVRQLIIPEGTYPASAYADAVNHLQAIKKADKERLVLTK